MEIFTKNARQTQEFGKKLADRLKGGEVLALQGDLGSGKTTFVQGLARGLGIEQRVLSPTFVLMRQYKAGIMNYELGIRNLYHVDLYRLEGDVEMELEGLGIEEIWRRRGNIVVIEWAEKAKGVMPRDAIWVKFEYVNDGRRIVINSKG